jgi:hypothetical protein
MKHFPQQSVWQCRIANCGKNQDAGPFLLSTSPPLSDNNCLTSPNPTGCSGHGPPLPSLESCSGCNSHNSADPDTIAIISLHYLSCSRSRQYASKAPSPREMLWPQCHRTGDRPGCCEAQENDSMHSFLTPVLLYIAMMLSPMGTCLCAHR